MDISDTPVHMVRVNSLYAYEQLVRETNGTLVFCQYAKGELESTLKTYGHNTRLWEDEQGIYLLTQDAQLATYVRLRFGY